MKGLPRHAGAVKSPSKGAAPKLKRGPNPVESKVAGRIKAEKEKKPPDKTPDVLKR